MNRAQRRAAMKTAHLHKPITKSGGAEVCSFCLLAWPCEVALVEAGQHD